MDHSIRCLPSSMKALTLPLVCLLILIASLVGNTQPPLPRHKPALLRLVLCVQKTFGATFDVELWEELVLLRNATGLVERRFCDTPLRPCLPSSPGKKKSAAGERYLATLILESISLCGAHQPLVASSSTPKGDQEVDISVEESPTYAIIIGVLVFINVTGILSGLVYKYRSDCSVRSKNNRRLSSVRHHGDNCGCNESFDVVG